MPREVVPISSFAEIVLHRGLQSAVVGKDHVAAVGDEQSTFDDDACCFQSVQFLDEGQWVENNATADNADDAVVENAGRDDVQDVALAAKVDGVSCVVSALVTCDAVKSFGQDIDDFSFTFITPLEADDGDILFHNRWVRSYERVDPNLRERTTPYRNKAAR